MLALLDFLHFFCPFLGEINAQRCPTEQEAHAGAVVDLDTNRTGHAVAAATAKVTRQLDAFLLDFAPRGRRQLRCVVLIRDELVQLTVALYAPNGKSMVELVEEGIGQSRVGDETASEGFHADEAHVVLVTGFHYLLVVLRGEVAERILQGVIAVTLYGFEGNVLAVVADAYKADFALSFGHAHGVIEALLVTRARAIVGIVELV